MPPDERPPAFDFPHDEFDAESDGPDWFDPGPGHPGHTTTTGHKRRWAKRAVATLMVLVAVVVGLFFFLVRTQTGQRIVLTQLLGQLQDAVNGRIIVDDIRARDLREGVTLMGLRIEGPEGRAFFMADSVKATYYWRTFFTGDVLLSSLDVFRPVLLVTRYPGEEAFNADVIFRTGVQEADTSGVPPRHVIFNDVVLVDGTVRVVYPEDGDPPARSLTVETPEGDILRRLAFDDINGSLPRAVVSSPEIEGPEVTVESLSMVARMYEEPAYLRDLAGLVTWADSELTIEATTVVMGETRASGTIVADFGDDAGMILSLDMMTSEARLADFQWVEPRIPEGTARGRLGLRISPTGLRWTFRETDVDLGESRVEADGVWVMGDEGMSFEGLSLDLSPLAFDRVRPWVEFDVPLDGRVRGHAHLDGTLGRLRAEGRLTFDEPGTGGPPTTADFRGIFHVADPFGVTDLRAMLDPLDYDLARKLFPALQVSGEGRARIEATGNLASGLHFTVDGVHRDQGVPSSTILARGSVREVGGQTLVDVMADAGPLSLTALRRYYPALPFSSEVRGTIRAVGPLGDLRLTTDLDTDAGRLALESRFDARDPGASYEIRGDVSRFRLSALIPALPDPTILTGNLFLRGRGVDLATADITARIRAREARVGRLHVDTAAADLRVAGGVLSIDTLDAVMGGVDVQARGSLAVLEGGPEGEIRVAFATDSVGGLRPLLLGDTVIARDTLTSLDRELLALEGIDADTLPTVREVDMTGAASGEVLLRGSLESFSAEGQIAFESLTYGDSFIRGGDLTFTAADLPSLDGAVHAELNADSLQILGRGFERGALDLDYTRPGGRFEVELVRSDAEDYFARSVFEVDTLGGRLDLEELRFRFDTLAWELERPATVVWDDRGLTLDNFVLGRSGDDALRLAASGTLPTDGAADFVLDIEGLDLARVTRIAQREDIDLQGLVGAHLEIRGTAADPLIDGTVEIRNLEYDAFELTLVAGEVGYRDRRITVDLEAWDEDLQVLTATGTVPADLSLAEVEDRIPSTEEIDLRVVADSLPATFVLSLVESLEEVRGTVNGDFTIAGTVDDPSPSGTLQLNEASFLLPALGVRYENVAGSLALRPDGTVEVDASARAGGTVEVTGTVDLEPLTDPTFDLLLAFDNFRAVSRRDVEGSVSGLMALGGTFGLPRIQGLESEGRGLVVDAGTLYLDEFQRSASIVDLSDPRFFDMADTTLARARPILSQSQNPFLRNLRVNVDLAVEGNTWLRSQEMNVEIGGDLVVVYDRQRNDIVLVGELEAIRGDYTLLGRRFEVVEGMVEFVGTPGINPNLDIQATTRVRRVDAEPLAVNATVSGTLVDPRVALSSGDAAVAEEDLISYLLFGQPSYALTSGQAASVQSAAGSLLGQGVGAGVSVGFGMLSSQIGTLVAREIGLDYFAISQPADLLGAGVAGLAQTTVELGRYLSDDLFLVLILQPFRTTGGTGSDIIGGVRLEWVASDEYTVEVFAEDRFLRSRSFGFHDLGFRSNLVYGVSAFWEWGY